MPGARITEDYLRILRFFRFYAAYGEGAPDPAALHACIAARGGLAALSRERVRMELLKLLVARRAAEAVGVMADAGLLVTILGGVPYLRPFEKMIAIEMASGEQPDAVRRLGALAVSIEEDALRLFERLRLSNAERDRLHSMADGWWHFGAGLTPQAARVLLYRLGPTGFTDRALLAWSRSQDAADDSRWRERVTLSGRWQPPLCPIAASRDDLARRSEGTGAGRCAARSRSRLDRSRFPVRSDGYRGDHRSRIRESPGLTIAHEKSPGFRRGFRVWRELGVDQ